jgi:hypothetical protein
MATTVAGSTTFFESDGKAVNVTLTNGDVVKGAVAVIQGWVGITGQDADSGETLALIVDDREYQFQVPAGLTVNKGDIVYITVATITGHYPDDEAYTTTAGSGKVALFKATAAKDANNIVTGIMLAHNALAS